MRKQKTLDQMQAIIAKEELEELYVVKRINKEKIAKDLGICYSALNNIIKAYNLEKKNKHKTFEELLKELDEKEFINYYNSHGLIDTANHFSTIPEYITKYRKYIGYERDKELTREIQLNSFKNTNEEKFNILLEKMPKDKLYNLYIIEDKTQEELCNIFNIKKDVLQKVLNYYNIIKNRNQIMNKTLNGLYIRFGGKDNYYKYFFEKRKENWIEKYGSFEKFNSQRSKKISDSWFSKSKEE